LPVHVRSTFKPDPGTLVTREDSGMEEAVVTSVTHDRNQAKVSILRVPDRPGVAAQVFGAVADQNIVVDMIVQNISRDGFTDMSFTLPRGDRTRAVAALEEVARRVGAEGVQFNDRVAKISIVGVGMRSHSGVAARMFAVLSKEGVNIRGSGLHFWRGDAPLRLPEDGWIYGHEMTGRVARLGARVKTDSLGRPLTEGDRVAYCYFYPCGRCHACLALEPAACPNKVG